MSKVFRLCEIPFSTNDFEEIFDKINKKNGKEIGTDQLTELALKCYKSEQLKRNSSRRKSESKSESKNEKQAEIE